LIENSVVSFRLSEKLIFRYGVLIILRHVIRSNLEIELRAHVSQYPVTIQAQCTLYFLPRSQCMRFHKSQNLRSCLRKAQMIYRIFFYLLPEMIYIIELTHLGISSLMIT